MHSEVLALIDSEIDQLKTKLRSAILNPGPGNVVLYPVGSYGYDGMLGDAVNKNLFFLQAAYTYIQIRVNRGSDLSPFVSNPPRGSVLELRWICETYEMLRLDGGDTAAQIETYKRQLSDLARLHPGSPDVGTAHTSDDLETIMMHISKGVDDLSKIIYPLSLIF
jgi:hypothetical protein